MFKKDKEKELLIKSNSKIDIYDKVKKTNELKEKYHEYEKIDSMWAKVVPQTGKLQVKQADTKFASVTHKIIVRYGAGKNITKDMYIICRGKRYDIEFILNPYNENKWLEIFCEELIE